MSGANQHHPAGKLLAAAGSKEQPFVIGPTSYLFSTLTQAKIIERGYGSGEYSPDSRQRRYHENPNGPPGNSDLCEHILLKSWNSVWFDRSEVTKYQAAHAKAVEEALGTLGANKAQIQRAHEAMAGTAPAGQEKRGGCLAMVVLLIGAISLGGLCAAVRATAMGKGGVVGLSAA